MSLTVSGAPDHPSLPLPQFVGRKRELGALRSALDQVLAGRGQVMLLAGEPGIGKTRLAEEVTQLAGERGALVLWGNCFEWEGAPAYWPWIQLLRALLQHHQHEITGGQFRDRAAAIAQLVPELRASLPDLPDLPAMQPELARFHLFDSVTIFLKQLALRQPLALVLDDLHWADAPSLLLVQFLAREIRDARLLLIGTYRTVEVGRQHPLNDMLVALARLPGTQRILLHGLHEDEVARFMALLADHEPARRLVEAVYQETEGNPFFVTEVVRLLAAEGRFTQSSAEPVARVQVPESVRQVVGQRLNHLPEDCNRLLALASVIGREFSVPLLARVSGCPVDQVLDSLDAAVDAKLIQDMPATRSYRFSHAMVQETLYDELSAARRMRLHRQVGEVLEAIFAGDLAAHDAELAHHFSAAGLAGDIDKAIRYATAAGARAMGQLAFETAAEHYQQALNLLELLDAPEPRQRCELLLALGSAENAIAGFGDSPAAREHFRQAALLARDLHLAEHLAGAVLGYAGRNPARTFGGAEQIELLEAAIDALDTADLPLRARLLSRLALDVRNYLDDVQRARELSDIAVEIAQRSGDVSTLAAVMSQRVFAGWLPENLEERRQDTRRVIEIAEQANDRFWRAHGYYSDIDCSLQVGDMPSARATTALAITETEALRTRYDLRIVYRLRELWAIVEGRLDEAERCIEKQIELGSGDLFVVRYNLSFLRYEQSRLRELREWIEHLRKQPPSDAGSDFHIRADLILIYLEIGDIQAAKRAFEDLARDDFQDIPRHIDWFPCLVKATEACVELGNQGHARSLYDLLLPFENQFLVNMGSAMWFGSTYYYLACLATTLLQWDVAERHFHAALDAHERTATPFWLAHTRHAYADMLTRRGELSDLDQAFDLVEQALVAAEEMGMTRLMERARALRDQLAARGSSGPAGRATSGSSLSPRELDVLRLIAQGQTDREIADVLFISPRTVTTHVTHILDKLGANTRSEAAALAIRNGII